MRVFVPHPFPSRASVYGSGTGSSLSGYNHIQALSMEGQVYVPSQEPCEHQDNVFGVTPEFATIASSIEWFKEQNFDALLMFEPNVDDLVFFRHVCPAPIVIRLSSCFGSNRDYLQKILQCYSLLRPGDALSPKSEWAARHIAEYVYDETYIRPITNGVDTDRFRPTDKKSAKRQLADLGSDDRFLRMTTVGFCSRFDPAKGAYAFLRAADLLPDLLFVVVGMQFIPAVHPPNVVFLGPQPYERMPAIYNGLDVLCAPSVYAYESCPSVILEGMASGLPIVASRFSGAEELLGDCGGLVDVDRFDDEPLNIAGYIDPQALSDSILKMLKDSSGERTKTTQRSCERAKTFSWCHIAQQHMRLIEELNRRKTQPKTRVPVTVHFTKALSQSGPASESLVFNYRGTSEGPLPTIAFKQQKMKTLEGLALRLSQELHPNELEAVLSSLVGDRPERHKLLDRLGHLRDMLFLT